MSNLAADFHTVDVHQPAPDQFTTTVKIGTPAQEFTVLINMDSAVLWVPDATCGQDACAGYCKDPAWCYYLCPAKCCGHGATPSPTAGSCGSRKKFISAQSISYQQNGTDFKEQLTTPAVGGFIGGDFVTLGKEHSRTTLQVQATLGQATEASFDDSMKYDGVFGRYAALV
ncbi:aspartic protease [Aphelenchoides avenae]|nr:aspartic protease [Aphelenchus avenae]